MLLTQVTHRLRILTELQCSLVDIAEAIFSDSRRDEIDDYRILCTLVRAPANDSILTRGGTA